MGAMRRNGVVVIILCLFFEACAVLESGFIDRNGQYVPKRPKYKLKGKQGNVIFDIDTSSIYKLIGMYDHGNLIFPKNNFSKDERYSIVYEINQVNRYLKFYNNGRCLEFSIPTKNNDNTPNFLKMSDLNPNSKRCNYSKNYYYTSDGKNIQIENFVYGAGQGHYVILNYIFSASKDTLTMQGENIKMIYKKEAIPLKWNKYKIDW